MTLASEMKLEELIGKKVRSTRGFSGVPVGTVGKVVEKYGDKRHAGVMVEWKTTGGYSVRDGFGRDAEFDETCWLDVLES